MTKHLLTLYTRTPLHVGCGTSVDVIDLPIMRERITKFPVIPGSSLKGVLREASRQHFGDAGAATTRSLFGEDRKLNSDENKGDLVSANAGLVQIMEAKLLAFPVRSLAGCFAWLTCPAALHRFQRDTGLLVTKDEAGKSTPIKIPTVKQDEAIVATGSELIVQGQGKVVLEEYAITSTTNDAHTSIVTALLPLLNDTLWKDKLSTRFAILHDEDFQHFVTTCTEVVSRIVINPETRTNTNLFNQENVPCETLFYSVLQVPGLRRKDDTNKPDEQLTALLKANPTLQLGGDETTGHGFCEAKHTELKAQA